jgi:hypothetical protein
MNRAIEIHDSTLDSLALCDGVLVLHFSSAYIHESKGLPGVDAGSGWVQEANLKIGGVEIVGFFSELPHDLSDGYFKLGDTVYENMIPVPLDHDGEVYLRLEKLHEVVSIKGISAKLELVGEATYVEEFRP